LLQIFQIVNLADELLPPLPQGTISLPMSYAVLVKGSSRKSPAASAGKQDESSVTNEASAREKLLEQHPELLKQFGMDLLPILTQVCDGKIKK
jgi:E3 ubiquitin-protein ligase TRIP12